jgi:O-antigen ligase
MKGVNGSVTFVWQAAGMRLLGFLLAGLGLVLAWVSPFLFAQAVGASIAVGVLFLASRHTTAFCVVWLLVTGCSLEMTFNDLVGPELFQSVIAGIKASQIGLAILCALRWGGDGDPWNPAWAFAAMAAMGVAHGLYPGLSVGESVRSLIGSVAPFAFCFVRAPPAWSDSMIRAARWCAIVAAGGGVVLAVGGIRPLFTDSGGMRLTGLGHPAFLATVCMASVYATLIRFYRTGRVSELALLGVNLVLLVLTGARAPLFFAGLVTALTFAFVPAATFPSRWRLLLLLGAGGAVPVLGGFMLAGGLGEIRLFNLLGTDATNLSGRAILWEAFEAVTSGSPWVGWGIGAGNVIIPPESQIAQLLHTWAAHNEYLRIEVEGGQLGRALLIGMFAVWVWRRTRALPRAEARIMQMVFLAFAGHAFTDNLLISTPACVLMTVAAAVFAGAESALPDAVPAA